MQSETGFPSSHQLKSYVASKSRLKLAARAVLSADAGLLVGHSQDRELSSPRVGESASCPVTFYFARGSCCEVLWWAYVWLWSVAASYWARKLAFTV